MEDNLLRRQPSLKTGMDNYVYWWAIISIALSCIQLDMYIWSSNPKVEVKTLYLSSRSKFSCQIKKLLEKLALRFFRGLPKMKLGTNNFLVFKRWLQWKLLNVINLRKLLLILRNFGIWLNQLVSPQYFAEQCVNSLP